MELRAVDGNAAGRAAFLVYDGVAAAVQRIINGVTVAVVCSGSSLVEEAGMPGRRNLNRRRLLCYRRWRRRTRVHEMSHGNAV